MNRCLKCGGFLYRSSYEENEIACLMCGQVANKVEPLDIPEFERGNRAAGPHVAGSRRSPKTNGMRLL